MKAIVHFTVCEYNDEIEIEGDSFEELREKRDNLERKLNLSLKDVWMQFGGKGAVNVSSV